MLLLLAGYWGKCNVGCQQPKNELVGVQTEILTIYERCIKLSTNVCVCTRGASDPHLRRPDYIGARTDSTQQTNICLGIHRQTRVATFNPTCLSRLTATEDVLSQNQ